MFNYPCFNHSYLSGGAAFALEKPHLLTPKVSFKQPTPKASEEAGVPGKVPANHNTPRCPVL